MENNFKCDCGKEFNISDYRILINKDGKSFYDKKSNLKLTCECGKLLNELNNKDFGVPMFGRFNSMNSKEKHDLLKKRSSKHFNKELKEKQTEMHKETFNPLLGK